MDERKRSRHLISLTPLFFALTSINVEAAGPHRHFDLDAGDASLMLNEFSRQSDLQVLFDFNILRGMKTQAVTGDLDASAALKGILKGTNLVFDFVNDHTLAVTPKKPSALQRAFSSILGKKKGKKKDQSDEGGMTDITIAANAIDGSVIQVGTTDLTRVSNIQIEESGFKSTPDLVHSIPIIWPGGPTEDTSYGREASANASHGSGINIRGVDAGDVLVLVDGHRMALTAGGYADIANLPLSALNHIDISADGPSMRYGADAVSGVVNFVTWKGQGLKSQGSYSADTDGGLSRQTYSLNLGSNWDDGIFALSVEFDKRDALLAQERGQATSNLTPWGGPNNNWLFGSPGTIISGAKTWALPSLVEGTVNTYDRWANTDLLPYERHFSLVGHFKQTLSGDSAIWFDGWLTRRNFVNAAAGYPDALEVPATNPHFREFNPAGGTDPVTVLYGFGPVLGQMITNGTVDAGSGVFGVDVAAGGWVLTPSFGYSFERLHYDTQNAVNETALDAFLADSNSATAFNPFGGSNAPSTLDAIRASLFYKYRSAYQTISLSASRLIAASSLGPDLKLEAGAEYRRQTFSSIATDPVNSPVTEDLKRSFGAAYAQLLVPVEDKLQLSLGTRLEHYNDGLHAFVPRLGLAWSPVHAVTIRGTWGKSFRPPNPQDKTNASTSQINALPDASSPTGMSTALLWGGSNSDLRAEIATTVTGGVSVTPTPGLSLAATYFHVASSERVVQPLLTLNSLQDPNFQGVIVRDAVQIQRERQKVCSTSEFFGDQQTCMSTPVSVIVDGRLQNLQRLTTDGFDLIGGYDWDSRFGKWSLGLWGTYFLSYGVTEANGEVSQLLGTQNNPTRLRAQGSLRWERGRLSALAAVHFTNRYHNTSDDDQPVASWTTIDMRLAYTVMREPSVVAALNVANVSDRYPPYLRNSVVPVAYDQENGDLYGRLVTVSLGVSF